ncbi:MAG: hypothetical protein K2K97_01015, partial [Muribaculaceae bacterium]|nr:hypothetical protein [Muribaculaceae bacterium]
MKRILFFGFLLTLLLGFSLDASALAVTFEWDTPGTIKIQRESQAGPWVDLSPDQTSYTATTTGWIYLYSTDGYRVTGAQSTTGDNLVPRTSENGSYVGVYLGASMDGRVYKISLEKVERNESFTIDLVNGASYVTAKFNTGYTLNLQEGTHSYNFDPEFDKTLTLSLSDIPSAYQVKLNGTDIAKNHFYPKYESINIKPGDTLFIQVFEEAEPQDCTLTLQYGTGMDGCLYNIYNRTTGVFVQPDELVNNSLVVKEDTELKVNFLADDYTITKLRLNGTDVTSSYTNNSIAVVVTEPTNTLQIEGKAKVYGNIDFTGYIVNADGVNFSLSYQGAPFALPQGTEVSNDIKVDASLTMPAGATKKYVIPISEKNGRFFFSPKAGYYISNLYTLTPDGTVEQHSGSASINAKIEGTTFYMMVEKLPESYSANLNVKGNDFNLRINASSALSDSWGNPSPPSYSPAEGEREISFIPGYGTPIVFGFVGDESQHPAVYLDGAEETGTVNSNSGATEYFITPYSPSDNSIAAAGVHSTIDVYNSFKERPQLSGASLVLEEDAEAEFFYSPVLHKANPEGQVVISGTQFTVRPASPEMTVTYKGQAVQLNENGEYVFNATGNARNNVVKVSPAPAAPAYSIAPADGSKVNNLSLITVTFPNVKEVEYNEIGIVLNGPETNFSSTDVHGSANIWNVTFRNPSVSGKYSVTFPAGAFTLDGAASPEISAEYDFETGWEILPAPGSTVESLNEIVLSFPQAANVEFVGEFYSFVLSNGNNYAAPGYDCTRDENATVPTYLLTLPAGVVPPIGSYTFTIEEGAFNIDGTPSAEIFVNYVIDRESSTEYYQTPAETIVYQDYGYDFAIIFEEGTTVGTSLDSDKIKLTFNGDNLTANDYMSAAEANTLMFMVINPDYIKEGRLKLEIEAGAFTLGSTSSPAISAEWNVVAPKTFEAEITTKGQIDDSGKASDLSEIYVFFPEATTGEIFQESGARLRTRDYSYSETGKISID